MMDWDLFHLKRPLDIIVIVDENFLVIKEINKYLIDIILINSFRSGAQRVYFLLCCSCYCSNSNIYIYIYVVFFGQ
jgi:hypothetical protein